jgi:hypothetical protein
MLCVSQLLCLRSHTPPPPLRHSVLHPPATPGDPLLSLLWHHAPRPQATQPLLARWDLEDRKLSICEIVRAADSPSLPGGPLLSHTPSDLITGATDRAFALSSS